MGAVKAGLVMFGLTIGVIVYALYQNGNRVMAERHAKYLACVNGGGSWVPTTSEPMCLGHRLMKQEAYK
jgi:hypothetical protein